VRGTRHGQKRRTQAQRIIPACAGNAVTRSTRKRQKPDHPRVCGERQSYAAISCGQCGSSPRVRGTPRSGNIFSFPSRIIPACAGNAQS